jgi:hypothetical protein
MSGDPRHVGKATEEGDHSGLRSFAVSGFIPVGRLTSRIGHSNVKFESSLMIREKFSHSQVSID